MGLFLTSLSVLLSVVLILGYIGNRFRAYRSIPMVESAPDPPLDAVSIIIPARNEESTIGRCLAGLLRQSYPHALLEILVVDDGSTDRTPEIVQQLTEEHAALRLISAGPLPEGWKGKPHACWHGALQARGEWLCFMDSDTAAEPALITSALSHARAHEVDLLSLQPFQEADTFWEKLLLPLGYLGVAFQIDLKEINNPRAGRGAANGQFILIRRRAYDAVDGHRSVRDEIVEDVALGNAVKLAGNRIQLMGGEAVISTRMYQGFLEIWEGLTKNAAFVFGGVLQSLVQSVLILIGALSPLFFPALALRTWILEGGGLVPTASLAVSGLALGLMVLFHASLYRFYRLSPFYALLFPFGYLLLDAILVASVWRKQTGRLAWKGRVYAS